MAKREKKTGREGLVSFTGYYSEILKQLTEERICSGSQFSSQSLL